MPPVFIVLFMAVISIPVALILGYSIGRKGRFGLAGWLFSAILGAVAGWWLFGSGYQYVMELTLWSIPVVPSIILSAFFVLAWLNIPGKRPR